MTTDRHPRLSRPAGSAEQRRPPLRRQTRLGAAAQRRDRAVELEVEDHGRGSEVRRTRRRGLGLVTMRERAELVGGTIEFLRPPEGGTLVRLHGATSPPTAARPYDRQDHRASRRRSRAGAPRLPPPARRRSGDRRSSAKRATATKRSRWWPALKPRGDRDGLRDAGHERARRDARDSRATRRRSPILMLSMHSEETLVRQALDAGRARLRPEERPRSRSCRGGQAGRRRRDGARSGGLTPPALRGEREHGLTPRELEVLQLICDGLSNRDDRGRSSS